MKKSVWLVALALWVCSVALAGGDPTGRKAKNPRYKEGGEVPKGKKKAELAAMDDATRRIKKILNSKKVSFDFVDTPAADALAFIRALLDINLVVGPRVNKAEALTLKVNDMNAESALRWMVKLIGAKMEIRDGAIFVSAGTEGARTPAVKRRVEGIARRVDAWRGRVYRRTVGKAQISLGDLGTVELYLYEGDVHPEVREVVLLLLRRTLEAELRDLDRGADREREEDEAEERDREGRERREHEE